MSSVFLQLFEKMDPLRSEKDPQVAAIVGFIIGGIGLGLYLRSFIDFIIPILIIVPVIAVAGDVGWLVGAAIASGYGYFRVVASNAAIRDAANTLSP